MKKTNKKIGLEHNGEPVMTTAQVAFMLETTVNEVNTGFNNHRSEFEKGEHYFVLQGQERRDFVERFPTPEMQTSSDPLILWTYKGVILLSIPIDTHAAWALYRDFIHRCCELGVDKGILW